MPIIAIEGIDGAGKQTLARNLAHHLGQRYNVANTISFPRYNKNIHAQLAEAALHGELGKVNQSPYSMALLFALDRNQAKQQLKFYAQNPNYLLICDRYVASNAAYLAAQEQDDYPVAWVEELEFGTLQIPKPDLQILLDPGLHTAVERAQNRGSRDNNETNLPLQHQALSVYNDLAKNAWVSPWIITNGDNPEDTADLIHTTLNND